MTPRSASDHGHVDAYRLTPDHPDAITPAGWTTEPFWVPYYGPGVGWITVDHAHLERVLAHRRKEPPR